MSKAEIVSVISGTTVITEVTAACQEPQIIKPDLWLVVSAQSVYEGVVFVLSTKLFNYTVTV